MQKPPSSCSPPQPPIKPTHYNQLINQNTKYALYISSGSQNFKQQKAYLWQPNQQSLGQIWQVIRIPDNLRYTNCYQIVHTRSTLVLTKVGKEDGVRLRFGEWLAGQMFTLEAVDGGDGGVYRFCSEENRDWYLYYDSHQLKLGVIDKNNKKCHWQIRQCTQNPIIKRSCYIQNTFSTHVIDIPRASLSPGCPLIQYPLNNRFNQRFHIHPFSTHFKISSLNSKLYLTSSKKCKQGDKITQQQQIQQENSQKCKQQLWIIQYQGRNSYLIRSAVNIGMVMGIKEGELRKETGIVVTGMVEFGMWKIVGDLPHRHQICNM